MNLFQTYQLTSDHWDDESGTVTVEIPYASSAGRVKFEEQGVVCWVEEGYRYNIMTARLFISVQTVRNRIRAICCKLEINSKDELLALSIRWR